MVWDRRRAAPEGVSPEHAGRRAVCLTWRGHVGNRAALWSLLGGPGGLSGAATDGDLVANLWQRHGDGALHRFTGSFAFLLWLPSARRMVAVTDRLGLHRFVYTVHGHRVAIGVSSPEVLAAAGRSAEVDRRSLTAHLLGAPPPEGATFHRGASVLEAGRWLEVTRDFHREYRWWSLTVPSEPIPRHQAVERVAETLGGVVPEAVTAALPATGGLGLTLSSGLDSGAVAAFLARAGQAPRAFTWTFPGFPEADEGAAAQGVARRLGLRHHLIQGEAHAPLSAPGAPASPTAGPSVVAYRELFEETFRQARRLGVTHVATGAGGDLLFGYCGPGLYGYPDLLLTGRWRRLASQLAVHLRGSEAPWWRILDLELVRPLLRPGLRPRRSGVSFPTWLSGGCRGGVRRLLAAEREALPAGLPARPGIRYRWRALAAIRWQSRVLDELGALGRQHGVELVHPLVDHRLWSLSAALPPSAHFDSGYHKAALRRALEPHLPASTVWRRRRLMPAAVFHHSLRRCHGDRVWPLLQGMRAADLGLVDEAELRRAFGAYLDGAGDTSFWAALTLEAWLRGQR